MEEPRTERIHYADNDILTADEIRRALQVSERQWDRIAPKLPVTYFCGPQLPRYVYGEVIAVLRKNGAAA